MRIWSGNNIALGDGQLYRNFIDEFVGDILIMLAIPGKRSGYSVGLFDEHLYLTAKEHCYVTKLLYV